MKEGNVGAMWPWCNGVPLVLTTTAMSHLRKFCTLADGEGPQKWVPATCSGETPPQKWNGDRLKVHPLNLKIREATLARGQTPSPYSEHPLVLESNLNPGLTQGMRYTSV